MKVAGIKITKKRAIAGFVVLLLLIGTAAVLTGNSGNTSSTSGSTSSNGNDPLLSAIAAQIQSSDSANNPTIQNWTFVIDQNPIYSWTQYQENPNGTNSASIPANVPTGNYSQVTINEQWTDSNGAHVIVAMIENEGSTANATADFNYQTAIRGPLISDGHETHYAEAEIAQALGHNPTTVRDISWHWDTDTQAATHEYIQYDNVLILLSQNLGITTNMGPSTPSS
jgi:hypothetical protein